MSEEKPPFYRFVNGSELDKIATEQAGVPQYKDVVYVFIRTPGDPKSELKDYARTITYDVSKATINVKKSHTFFRDGEEVAEEITVPEEKNIYTKRVIYPRLEKLKDWVKNGHKSQNILIDYEQKWEHFLNKEDAPIVGTPLKDWNGAPESVRRRAIDIGLRSVEEVADMDDATIQNIGMGGRDMKNKAIAFLDQNLNPLKAAAEISELKKMLTEMQVKLGQKEDSITDELDEMNDEELLQACRDAGEINAGPHWKRETLIRKIREARIKEAA